MATRGKRRMLSQDERDQASQLFQEGASLRKISKVLNTNISVISRMIQRLETTGTTEYRPRSGRPRIVHTPNDNWTLDEGSDKPYKCNHCGKGHPHFSYLATHLRIHTGERPFTCEFCGKTFVNMNTLKRHRLSHTGEKAFMCDVCAKQFADKGSMKIHMRIHTGERPYVCSVCGKGCVTCGNLNKHMRVHGIEMPVRKRDPPVEVKTEPEDIQ